MMWHSANIINDLHVCKYLKDNVRISGQMIIAILGFIHMLQPMIFTDLDSTYFLL